MFIQWQCPDCLHLNSKKLLPEEEEMVKGSGGKLYPDHCSNCHKFWSIRWNYEGTVEVY